MTKEKKLRILSDLGLLFFAIGVLTLAAWASHIITIKYVYPTLPCKEILYQSLPMLGISAILTIIGIIFNNLFNGEI